jgi:hypothetical protein
MNAKAKKLLRVGDDIVFNKVGHILVIDDNEPKLLVKFTDGTEWWFYTTDKSIRKMEVEREK